MPLELHSADSAQIPAVPVSKQQEVPEPASPPQREATTEPLSLQDIERKHILETLKRFGGNKSKAARVLNISRSTLREKLKLYGIN